MAASVGRGKRNNMDGVKVSPSYREAGKHCNGDSDVAWASRHLELQDEPCQRGHEGEGFLGHFHRTDKVVC